MPRVVILFQNNSHLADCPRRGCLRSWEWRDLRKLEATESKPEPGCLSGGRDSTLFALWPYCVHTHLMQRTCWLGFHCVITSFEIWHRVALREISIIQISPIYFSRANTFKGYVVIVVLDDVARCWPSRGESEIREGHILNKSNAIQSSFVNAIEGHFFVDTLNYTKYILEHLPLSKRYTPIEWKSHPKGSCVLFFISFLRSWKHISALIITYCYGVQICLIVINS